MRLDIPFEEGDGFGIVEELIEVGLIFLVDEFVDSLDIIKISFSYKEVIVNS